MALIVSGRRRGSRLTEAGGASVEALSTWVNRAESSPAAPRSGDEPFDARCPGQVVSATTNTAQNTAAAAITTVRRETVARDGRRLLVDAER
jgi:hypothetical protein